MRRYAWLALIALSLVACKRSAPPPAPQVEPTQIAKPPVDAGPKPDYRKNPARNPIDPKVTGVGKTYMVVSESRDASKAGAQILAAGGNAVDAAVATAFALAVAHPSAGNLTGGGFAVVRTGSGKATTLDFRETAPAAATETMYLDKAGNPTDKSRIGHLASGVPGSVAGLYELHKKLGKLPWKKVIAPAISLASDGFEIDHVLAKSLAHPMVLPLLERFPATAAIWLDHGKPKAENTVVKIPELAAVLERIRDKGPDGFYKGETAKLIVDEMNKGGGIITAEDLANYKPIWRDPIQFSYRGDTVYSMPPPSSGGIVLAMTAGMLRGLQLGKIAWHGVDHIHRLAEVWRRAFSARNALLGDPAYVKDMPIAKLTSQDYLDKLAATITMKATPSKDVPKLIEGIHTTNLCVVDGKGMAVALTTTLNGAFGSGVTIPGGGFLMNNEMDDFTAKPGSPNMFGLVQSAANKIEPGKRMLSSMSPTVVEDEHGDLKMLAGAGGGPKIITSVWQTLSNVIDFGEHADLAVASPRIHQQDLPDLLRIEAGSIDETTDKSLEAMGHHLDWGQVPRWFGAVNAIVRGDDGWEGAADPRGGGAAIGD